jgi:hypothetical protein
MENEPHERIALNLPVSVKRRVDEWRRTQPEIQTWTGAARHLLVVGLEVEDVKKAKAEKKKAAR